MFDGSIIVFGVYYKCTVLLPKLFLRCYLFILKIQIFDESL